MVGNEENTFPTFVEALLKIDDREESKETALGQIPCINSCLSAEALREQDGKLVRFDCQIIDMFEEEYYVGVLSANTSDSTAAASTPPLVYKYFTALSQEQMATY